MHRMRTVLLGSLLLLPATVLAAPDQTQPVPPMASEHRLSPEEVEQILDEAAHKRELAEQADEAAGRAIHGEIGFSVGTGGYRSAFGTAIVPLPDDGVAILSFGTNNFGPDRFVDHRER